MVKGGTWTAAYINIWSEKFNLLIYHVSSMCSLLKCTWHCQIVLYLCICKRYYSHEWSKQYVIHENHGVSCYYRTTKAPNGSTYTHQLFISRKNAHPAGFSWLGSSNFWNSEIKTSLSVVPMELNCWSSLPSSSLSTSILNFNQN